MQRQLNRVNETDQRTTNAHVDGRLGPRVVKYDVAAYIGSFIISNDRLGVSSQCNFGSVRANTCVYKGNLSMIWIYDFDCEKFLNFSTFCELGKWQYELQLGSKGVMQVGWSTVSTKFSQEKGVGKLMCKRIFVASVCLETKSVIW